MVRVTLWYLLESLFGRSSLFYHLFPIQINLQCPVYTVTQLLVRVCSIKIIQSAIVLEGHGNPNESAVSGTSIIHEINAYCLASSSSFPPRQHSLLWMTNCVCASWIRIKRSPDYLDHFAGIGFLECQDCLLAPLTGSTCPTWTTTNTASNSTLIAVYWNFGFSFSVW